MNMLKRTISLILVFQLCWACNGSSSSSGVVKTGGSSSSGASSSMTISGTITSLMDLVMASAMAQNGDLVVQDITDPDNPVVLHSESLSGTNTFSVTVKKSDVAGGRLIKATYTSSDSPNDGSRSLLFNLAGSEATVDASMNSDTTMNSMVFEQQLLQEKNRGDITGADYLNRFKAIKNDDHTSEFDVLGGDKTTIKKLLLDPNNGTGISDLLASLKYARIQGDLASIRDYKEKLFFLATDQAIIPRSAVLNCSANEVSFLFRDQSMRVYARGLDLEVMQALGSYKDLGAFGDSRTAADEINIYLSKLSEIGQKFGKIVSAKLFFASKDGTAFSGSCRVFSEAMTAAALAAARMPSYQFELDRTNFNKFKASDYSDLDSAHEALFYIYIDSMKLIRDKIKTAVALNQVDPSNGQYMYIAGMDAAGELYDQKFLGAYNTFFPSTLASNPFQINLGFEKNILYDAYGADFNPAYSDSDMAFNYAVDDLKNRINNAGVDPASFEFDRTYDLWKQFHQVRREQIDWWAGNSNL